MRTFFCIFMIMKDIRELTNGMWSRKNVLLPNVWVYEIDDRQQRNTFRLSLVYDGRDEITEDFMSNIYTAYYNYLVRSGVDFNDPLYDEYYMSIKSLYITCGIGLSYVSQNDILSANNNILQSFVRHYYTVPTGVKDIPKSVENDSFILPHASVDFINSKIITNLLAQEKMPGKIKIHFNMVKKGTLQVDIPNLGMCDIHYELPDHSLKIETNPNNFRIEGVVMATDKKPILLTPDPSKQQWFINGDDSLGGVDISNKILQSLVNRMKLNKLKMVAVGLTRNTFKYTHGE